MTDFRTDRTRYSTHRANVKNARDHVRRIAFNWQLDESVITAMALITSELVTNAMLHAHPARGREIGVTLHLTSDVIRLEVRDAGSGIPAVREATEDDSTGRGLFLVEALSDRMGHLTQVVGKIVFAEIDLSKTIPAEAKSVVRV